MTDDQPVSAAPEQPPIGGFCDDCGHFAARHDELGCHFPRPATNPCDCAGMQWQGVRWPRPWMPAPDGLTKEKP